MSLINGRVSIALLALFAWTPVLSAQDTGVTVDALAEQFRQISASRDTVAAEARAQWLFATFEATRVYPGRVQPEDTGDANRALELARAPRLYMPLSDRRGPQLVIWYYGSEFLPSATLEDYELILAHLNGCAE